MWNKLQDTASSDDAPSGDDEDLFIDVLDDPEPALPAVVRRMRQRRMWHLHNRRAMERGVLERAAEGRAAAERAAAMDQIGNNIPPVEGLRPPAAHDLDPMGDDDMLVAAMDMAGAELDMDGDDF